MDRESFEEFMRSYFSVLNNNSNPLTYEQYCSLLNEYGLVQVDGAMYALNTKATRYAPGGVYEGIQRYIQDAPHRQSFESAISACIAEVKHMADNNYCNDAFQYELTQAIKNLQKRYC